MRFLLIFLVSSYLIADTVDSGWIIGHSCSSFGTTSNGNFSAQKGTFSATGTTACARTSTNFTKFSFTDYTGSTLPYSSNPYTYYSLDAVDFLVIPPILQGEDLPIFTIYPDCPTVDLAVNWITVQWDLNEQSTLQDTYLLGTAEIYSNAGQVIVSKQYDVDGTLIYGATGDKPIEMSLSRCQFGKATSTSSPHANLIGTLYYSAIGGGVYKSTSDRGFFFFPKRTIATSELASKTFAGIQYDSTAGIDDIKQVEVTSDSAGTTYTIKPYSDVEAGTIDTTSFTDTITINYTNSPNTGMMIGTVSRNNPSGTGNIGCIVHKAEYQGVRVICSGVSPGSTNKPYNLTFINSQEPTSNTPSTTGKRFTKLKGVSGKRTRATAIAADTTNNCVYVTGTTNGNLSGSGPYGTSDYFLIKYYLSTDVTESWAKQYGSANKATSGKAIATNSNFSNIYITGSTTGNFSGGSSTGTSDYFLVKYDISGNREWITHNGVSNKRTYGTGVAVDSSGYVYVVGVTYGNLSGSGLSGYSDAFIAKYNSSGTLQSGWPKQFGDAGNLTYAEGIAIDSSDNIYIVGTTSGELCTSCEVGTYDAFLRKINTSGVELWINQLGVSYKRTYGRAVKVDSSGNIYIFGDTTGGLNGGTLHGVKDQFVAKYNSGGSLQWVKQFGKSKKYDVSYAGAVSSTGVFLIGITLLSNYVESYSPTGYFDYTIHKLNLSTGATLTNFPKQFGEGKGTALSYGAVCDSSGNIYSVGETDSNLDSQPITGERDMFITSWSADGS